MIANECRREPDVLEAVQVGRCDDDLRLHIDSCTSCGDLFEVGTLLFAEGRSTAREARVDSSGLAWWRIQLRLRREAARTADRALTTVQAASLAIAVILGLSILGTQFFLDAFSLENLSMFAHWGTPLVVGVAATIVLAPLAIILAVAER